MDQLRQKDLKYLRVAKEVVFCSQSVGEQIQALFSITVDLRQTKKQIITTDFVVTSMVRRLRCNGGIKCISIYLSFHLSDSV